MKPFKLKRKIDTTGLSKIGIVAEGINFSDGVCVLHWIVGEVHSTTIFKDINEVKKINCHGGDSVLEF